MEFLPVYHPNEEEKEDAKLFANNVRLQMATQLNVPVVDRSVSEFVSSTWSVNSALRAAKIEFAPPYVLEFVENLTHN